MIAYITFTKADMRSKRVVSGFFQTESEADAHLQEKSKHSKIWGYPKYTFKEEVYLGELTFGQAAGIVSILSYFLNGLD